MQEKEHDNWTGRTDGAGWMHRSLNFLLSHIDVRVLYCIMAVVILFYMLFNHRGYISMYHFFRRRMGYGPVKSFFNVYLNHYKFGQVILDRFAMYAGKTFDIEIEGFPYFEDLSNKEEGFVQLSCHFGNYELAGYSLRSFKKIYALVFAKEAEAVMEGRAGKFDANNIEMVPVGDDLSHMITISSALSDGNIVSIPADRIFGSSKSVTCEFLGAPAKFPLGPFAIAVQKAVSTLAVFVVKISAKKYKIMVKPITIEEGITGRKEKMEALAASFVRTLESVVREYPQQWFNYYEFWDNA